MTEFVKVKTRKKVNGILDPHVTSEENQTILKENLHKKKTIVEGSTLYERISKTLDSKNFAEIRCVALGSPSQEEPALFQLALLQLIAEKYNINAQQISLYDPVFSELDQALFKSWGYQVSEPYSPRSSKEVLFFLPHAPLALTNLVISSHSPYLFLANNIQTHTERLTKSELFEKYPLLCKLVSLVDGVPQGDDGFEAVIKKKSRKQKNKFTEPTLDYSKIESYFSKADIESYKEYESGEWLNSFTDLSFHLLE